MRLSSFVVAAAVWLTVPAVAAAQEDLTEPVNLVISADTVVEVDQRTASAEFVTQYMFINPPTNEAISEFVEIIPSSASDVEARSRGLRLDSSRRSTSGGSTEWAFIFPAPIEPGAPAVRVEVSWEMIGLDGEPNEFDRVSDTHIAIAPYGVGRNVEESTITVRVSGDYEPVVTDGYVQTNTSRGSDFVATVAAEQMYRPLPLVLEAPDRLEITETTVGGINMTLASVDSSTPWLVDDLPPLVEELSRWIPFDPPEQVEFRQGFSGGAGARLADDGTAVLPIEGATVGALAEVAAAWLEELDFVDDGLRRDFAGALANRVAVAQGVSGRAAQGQWSTAMTALTAVSDAELTTTVLTALAGGIPAYGGADDTFSVDPVDWRRFTDVYQHLGGIESAADAMRLSAAPEQREELSRREEALVDYRALESRAAPWLMPPLLRDLMAGWDFGSFAAELGAVSDLIEDRDEMVVFAEEVGLAIGDRVQRAFELSERSIAAAAVMQAGQRSALDHVAEALKLDTGDRGLLSSLGMVGRDSGGQRDEIVSLWDAGEFEAAAEASEHLVEDYESAVGRGTLRLLPPLTAIVLVGLAFRWVVQRMLAQRTSTQPTVE